MGRKNNYSMDMSRVIAFLSLDYFSVEVVLRLYPELKGMPLATRWAPNDRIDCVSYETTDKYKVFKGMTELEARSKCPNIRILSKSQIKEFIEERQQFSIELFEVIKEFCYPKDITYEKSSPEDLYIDLTDKCNQFQAEDSSYKRFLENIDVITECGNRQNYLANNTSLHRTKWVKAAIIMTDLCDHIYHKTGLNCSIGISFNKLLAKIGCNLNKPDNTTIIPSKAGIARVFKYCPLWMCDGLGSKKGLEIRNRLKISTLHQLREYRRQYLIKEFGKAMGAFLWDVSRGICNEPVKNKSDFSSKSFPKNYYPVINSSDKQLLTDLRQLCEKMERQLNEDFQRNQRIANRIRIKIFTQSVQTLRTTNTSITAFLKSRAYNANEIYDKVMAKGFPYINQKVGQYIKRFVIIAFDFKSFQNLDPISDLSQQMSGTTLY